MDEIKIEEGSPEPIAGNYEGDFVENRVVIWDAKQAAQIWDSGFYGKPVGEKNELSLTEAMYLVEREKLTVKHDGKKITQKKFFDICVKADDEFSWKYAVYKDMRNRGLLVKTGFKFGTHFRVYDRGVKLKKGPKETREHTKWIVHSIPSDFRCSLAELARAVRLAHNIRARMLWAVVDEEGDITYYEVVRVRP